MAYTKQVWRDLETGGTPITAERLNHIEDGIEENSQNWDSISPIFKIVDVNSGSVSSNTASWQEAPNVEGYLPISACFVGTFTGSGSRWIIGNPFLAEDTGIVLIRMFNNNSGSSTAIGKLAVMYIKKEAIGDI